MSELSTAFGPVPRSISEDEVVALTIAHEARVKAVRLDILEAFPNKPTRLFIVDALLAVESWLRDAGRRPWSLAGSIS